MPAPIPAPLPALPPPIVDAAWLDAGHTLSGQDSSGQDGSGQDGSGQDGARRDPEFVDREFVLCDVRSTMASSTARADFEAGHVPGAVFVSLEDDLSAPAGPVVGRHPLPTPEHFAAALGRLGIADDAVVLAFDDRGGAFAARLVWMLRVIGRPAALVLVNVLRTLSTTSSREARAPVARTPRPWPAAAIADADRVQAHIAAGGTVIDSREAARYAGEVEPIDAVAGHVPGAINVAFAGNLDADGRFLGAEQLAARFADAGVDGDSIVYCGSGVTACHNALAIEHAGLGLPAVYVGSWSGWSTDPARPVATGPEP